MYSVLFSRIEYGMDLVINRLKEIIPSNSKVAILPWAFPNEIDGFTLDNEYFNKDGRRYNRYVNEIKKLSISSDNIVVCNCYTDSKEKLRKIINQSDILLLPGGNPEMFFRKVIHDTELLYDIKNFKGIIMGESAGACLQFKRYFITAKNNYYKYFAFYDGFGVLDDPFYVDVHSINNSFYMNRLKKVATDAKKVVYAIHDDGALIFNRSTNSVELFGNVKKIDYNGNNYE